MIFPTVEFAIFFPVVLALSWALMPRPRLWKPFMHAMSYLFYCAADWRFGLLLAAITLANQAAALLLGRTTDERRRTQITTVAVVERLLPACQLGASGWPGRSGQIMSNHSLADS